MTTQSATIAPTTPVHGARSAARRHRGSTRLNGYPWILPAFVFVVGLIYYSVFYTGYISTLDWDGLAPTAKAVGLGNFTKMFADPVFWAALRHTAVFYVVTFTVQTALGFVLAAIMHSRVRLAMLHKVVIFIPTVLARPPWRRSSGSSTPTTAWPTGSCATSGWGRWPTPGSRTA